MAKKPSKVVLTIHDIGFVHDHNGWKRWLMKKIWITWPLRCVDQLITVSEATKKAVLKEAPWFSTRANHSNSDSGSAAFQTAEC